MPSRMTVEKFWSYVDIFGECWEWQGGRKSDGYGKVCWAYRHSRAHRVAYELSFGSIPEGMQVLHRCDNPPCVRPSHLYIGTHRDNMRDMILKGRSKLSIGAGLYGPHPWSSPLTGEQVQAIRDKYTNGGGTQRQLGREFGVSSAAICKIVNFQNWKHI